MSFNTDRTLVRLFLFIRKSALFTMLIITVSFIGGCGLDRMGLEASLKEMKYKLNKATNTKLAEGEQKLAALKSSPNDSVAQHGFANWLRNSLQLDYIDDDNPFGLVDGEDYDEDAIVRAFVTYYSGSQSATNATMLEIIDLLLLQGSTSLSCSVANG